ncbi:putative aminotransferase [Nemania sp. FL0916]|nr:putative aminotransferase [Nemania sp. FL0916]
MSFEAWLRPWIQGQKLRGPKMKEAAPFYRNLEEALDNRRADHAMFTPNISAWKSGKGVDFCSTDLLSLGATGRIREAFLEELARHPEFDLYSGGVRMLDGNYEYIESVEREIAEFHGAETAVIVSSGFDANVAIFTAIPRPGDAIVYDELVHASTIDGMVHSLALSKTPFRHNDGDALREILVNIMDDQPMIKDGTRCILVAVESIYSMDGDVCPLRELVEVAREVCPKGNVEFIVDEAHSTGVLGPKGAGLVNSLGMEKEIAVVLHTCGKGLASSGGIILGNSTVRATLTNFARSVLYSTAPTFPMVAAMRAGYNLLRSGDTQKPQDNIQHLTRYFLQKVASNAIMDEAADLGIVWVPLCDDFEERDFISHVIPIRTREKYSYWLSFHLQLGGYCLFPIDYPVVPKGQSRVRLIIHGGNTEAEVDGMAESLFEWAKEMIEIEKSGDGGPKIPKAALKVYGLMAAG